MTSPRPNRGPAAGPANRAALIAAAREVFAELGPAGPLALIAKKANVGKGSLYRQFPTREHMILAVFEQNLAELEHLATVEATTAADVVEAIAAQLTESVGFLAFLAPSDSSDGRLFAPGQRVRDLLHDLLTRGRRGALRADLTIDEVFMAVRMLGSLLYVTPESDRRTAGAEAWKLLRSAIYGPN
ncbi:TetR/AcrR family transcriptional regulator [Nocardia rhizosphaerihabitans]|uniref:TetR/AcrR family transcriptional regulator n=1 Tax=Nocardia rhizosphaerihabitans TaxID=1691570 RepID=UPI00366E0E07